MTITVGTNGYITVANATTYFSSSLRSASWAAISDSDKEKALITATRMLDRQVWAGSKTSDAQALQWPRSGVTDAYGNEVSSASVPSQIIDANCELALALYTNSSVETDKNTSTNAKYIKAGSAAIAFFRPLRGGRFPTIIQELVGQFLTSAAAIAIPEAFGTCEESAFDTCNSSNDFSLTGGT